MSSILGSFLNIVEKQHDLYTVKSIKMNSALIISKKVNETSELCCLYRRIYSVVLHSQQARSWSGQIK
ncbi:MAG: hypothetical protein BWY26_00017 [Elusimicrobia bacterium ADurb.Bin231]|nr:MAG: hypothetical protein BWY26_00017 [Elusimicrobia bacterium ADurb.Bin231]